MATELHELLITDYDIVEIAHDGVALIEATRRALPDLPVKTHIGRIAGDAWLRAILLHCESLGIMV